MTDVAVFLPDKRAAPQDPKGCAAPMDPLQKKELALPGIMGIKMRIKSNNCPSELRRPVVSPYVVIQKLSRAYYLKKKYWCKVYEVEYSLLKNPLAVAGSKEQIVQGTTQRSFVAATGDELGMYGEGASPEEAVSELQAKLSASILQMLEEGLSHCLPTKRKYQDVLLKDFEEEMVSHGVTILSPPKYVAVQVCFDAISIKKAVETSGSSTKTASEQEQSQAETPLQPDLSSSLLHPHPAEPLSLPVPLGAPSSTPQASIPSATSSSSSPPLTTQHDGASPDASVVVNTNMEQSIPASDPIERTDNSDLVPLASNAIAEASTSTIDKSAFEQAPTSRRTMAEASTSTIDEPAEQAPTSGA